MTSSNSNDALVFATLAAGVGAAVACSRILSVKEQKLAEDLLAKEREHAEDLRAKEREHAEDLLAKEEKHAEDLLAKEREHEEGLRAKDNDLEARSREIQKLQQDLKDQGKTLIILLPEHYAGGPIPKALQAAIKLLGLDKDSDSDTCPSARLVFVLFSTASSIRLCDVESNELPNEYFDQLAEALLQAATKTEGLENIETWLRTWLPMVLVRGSHERTLKSILTGSMSKCHAEVEIYLSLITTLYQHQHKHGRTDGPTAFYVADKQNNIGPKIKGILEKLTSLLDAKDGVTSADDSDSIELEMDRLDKSVADVKAALKGLDEVLQRNTGTKCFILGGDTPTIDDMVMWPFLSGELWAKLKKEVITKKKDHFANIIKWRECMEDCLEPKQTLAATDPVPASLFK